MKLEELEEGKEYLFKMQYKVNGVTRISDVIVTNNQPWKNSLNEDYRILEINPIKTTDNI